MSSIDIKYLLTRCWSMFTLSLIIGILIQVLLWVKRIVCVGFFLVSLYYLSYFYGLSSMKSLLSILLNYQFFSDHCSFPQCLFFSLVLPFTSLIVFSSSMDTPRGFQIDSPGKVSNLIEKLLCIYIDSFLSHVPHYNMVIIV